MYNCQVIKLTDHTLPDMNSMGDLIGNRVGVQIREIVYVWTYVKHNSSAGMY